MSVNSQDTYVNILTPLSIIGSGGSVVSSFSTIFISSASVDYLNVVEINNFLLSSQIVEAEELYASTISTLALNLDNSLLTTVGTELLLNGIPLATTSNISSLSDWALDPAVSTLNMNGNSSINGSLTSTNVINAGSGLIGSLVCNDISTVTLTVQSTIHVVSTLSSLQIEAQSGIFSSINGIQIPQGIEALSSFNTASVSSLTASSINGLSYPPPNSDVSQWATFPATSTITGGAGATDDLKLSATRFLNANASGVNIVVDEGANVASLATFSVTAQNGNRGNIALTANPGVGGVFGQIGLTANGGSVLGVGAGGLIELTANTPLGTLCNATSAIKFSAAGINSYAGAVPPIGSLLGYNFIYGTLGVNLCAGLPPLLPNTAGTTYLYGTTGITLGSQTNTASDITQSSGAGLFTTLVTGYWPGGVFSPSNLVIRGRQIPVYGNSYVQLCNVDILSFDSGARKAITGVSTINGAAYPPPVGSVPSDLVVSTLVARDSVGTLALSISSINGGSYPPPTPPVVIPSDLVVSTLTASTSVIAPLISVSTLVNISTINGASYPPAVSIPPSLVVSSLTAAVDVITFAMSADTVLANVYVCTPQILVSTLSTRVANISTLTVSSIVADTIQPRSVVIAGDNISAILLDKNASAPIVSQPIIARASATGGLASTQTQYLRLQGTGESTAFLPQFFDTVTASPSTIGHLGANTLYLGSDTVTWATIRASGNASTIVMSGELSVSSISVSTINGGVKQATYYTSTVQTLVSGNNDVIFDSTGAWNNDGGYITHTAGTSSFTVVNTGLYQLEFNAVVLANGAIYSLTTIGKQVAIDVTRGTEQSVIANTALQASQQNYSMSVSATYYLNATDTINLRVRNDFTGGPPTIFPVANTFDLNTFFTWRFIS